MNESPAENLAFLWWIALALLALSSALAVYRFWPLLHPPLAAVAVRDPDCNLHAAPCTAAFPAGGTVGFDIAPQPIRPVTPLRLQVTIAGLEVRAVAVDFVGVEMNMGFNRVSLTERETGIYVGQGMLPICVRTRMDWEASVLIETPQGILAAPFRFETAGR